MTLFNQAIMGYFKPRFLLDDRSRCAYEFMDSHECLTTITDNDICWNTVENLINECQMVIRGKCFHYPSFISSFQNGVALVEWQLNPDGRYYTDDDGFGMTDDEEVNIYGFIDRLGNVVMPFRAVKNYRELNTLRLEAESAVQ